MASKCPKCDKNVLGKFTDSLEKKWHPWCFLCDDCEKPIFEDKFRTDGEVAVHANCLTAERSRPCAKCGNEVGGTIVNALEKLWHPDCFTCHRCQKLINKKFKLEGGKPVHRECKPKHTGKRKKHQGDD
eukprot:NODE_4295_length_832_cov_48.678161_g3967_i0.p1 GENE.NODE_4295_length_832_cov_48.678161_g3967_i0~~NODE_4295_length_832_cov_48.678161_g3967_i0.p1  ORF type:complete len:129 (+),score=21.39 NODE_4295_length_832_cov_48.678161_g3967_i0:173-559(+)